MGKHGTNTHISRDAYTFSSSLLACNIASASDVQFSDGLNRVSNLFYAYYFTATHEKNAKELDNDAHLKTCTVFLLVRSPIS
jgi:hypothetical protein